MQVFALRDRLVKDYRNYAESFLTIRDARVREHVRTELDRGLLWPDPQIQLNPAFEAGETIDELVGQGILHQECGRIFRVGKEASTDAGHPLRLHRHQADAIVAARTGGNYVLTTGTGSGKSLAYIVPIVDHVLRRGSGRGIQAIVVYPMNALANSQAGELEKFLSHGYPDGRGPVRFRRYTGQDSDDERQAIMADPPDVLLTNYVMLELLLTRPYERKLVEHAKGLGFLVLDELHTYRGRQGADVALLARRVRDACEAERLQCVGTSATLAGPGTYEEQRKEVARVASTLFGDEVRPENVIGETLRRAIHPLDDSPETRAQLARRVADSSREGPPDEFDEFIRDPLAGWIEQAFGVSEEPGTERLVRSSPRSSAAAATELSALTGGSEEACAEAIRATLLAGSERRDPKTGFPAFAFRLHQFFSGGSSVWASLEPGDRRYITTSGQQYVPGDRSKALLPLAFCRECGQEYYSVRERSDPEGAGRYLEPREISDRAKEEDAANGYLFFSSEVPWSDDPAEVLDRVPSDWIEPGATTLKRSQRANVPRAIRVGLDGSVGGGDLEAHFVPAPFRFCLNCGVSYGARQTADFGKLTSLGAGGRSTSTTILGLSALRSLRNDEDLDPEARKLLSFTDNRQDASLQAGHFNDFVEIGLLRSGLQRAVAAAGSGGLAHDELTQRVFDALALDPASYAAEPELKGLARRDTDAALRAVIGYRLYRDLERGWRLTSPNLEQVGLLEIRYEGLEDACADQEIWDGRHAALSGAGPATRERVAKALLDYMRRELALKVDFLHPDRQERIRQQSGQRLAGPWALDEVEELVYASTLFPRPRRDRDERTNVYASPRGSFGQYLRRKGTLDETSRLSLDDTARLIDGLLDALRLYGLVEVVEPKGDRVDDVPGYQLPAAALRWVEGSDRPLHDPLRTPRASSEGGRVNPFFADFYREMAADGKGLEAREHTAQVPSEERERREERFREALLPLLFCSPTMELGVDIKSLNVVNLRNVPPTPANYAQRSGRAGRSGQPALVFSFCSSWNSHDQYFFRRPHKMVSGQVAPPALDLANEDLIRAHVHALWLFEARLALGKSLTEVLDVSGDEPTLALLDSKRAALADEAARGRARKRAERVLATIGPEFERASWYSGGWLDQTLAAVEQRFEAALERWRGLYRAAHHARAVQHAIVGDASRPQSDRNQARRLRSEAETQLNLLISSGTETFQSDFYPYRYFASEGFLPGYSFPRLPLSAYVPARRRGQRDEFVSRPRFLAVTEFGPRSIVYHEGSRYVINRVILPVASDADQGGVPTEAVKHCGACGYTHLLLGGGPGPDLCELCHAPLDEPLRGLLRLQNVSTKRRDRISSDEEERQRQGFEVRTGIRFAEHDGRRAHQTARIERAGQELGRLDYGSAATITRINVGWSRRANPEQLGFVLDTERGYWQSNEQATVDDADDPMSPSTRRVVPFVEDSRNCLLLELSEPVSREAMASLQAALKRAIQAVFQLEESELAAEPLPSADARRSILFFEAAEGGAGVVRRLLEDPEALSRVAREALSICHFDSETGKDLEHAPGAREACEAACYDCLLSYSNQRDHRLLDRGLVKPVLESLAKARVAAASGAGSAAEHLERLRNQAGSQLESRWLELVEARGLHLPSHGQQLIADCATRPDFLYADAQAAVFIDGPDHDESDVAERDRRAADCLEDLGYEVIRFRYDEDWEPLFARYPSVFGTLASAPAPSA